MNLAGIDSCPFGWSTSFYINGQYSFGLFENFRSLIEEYGQILDRILVDIPIGLSSKTHKRTIDAKLRKALPGRQSTVFNAPCRQAVYESDNELAKRINQEIESKSLSIQSLLIRDKIRQVDECLIGNSIRPKIYESHPEFCFKNLNGSVLQSRKSTLLGIQERLNVINQYEPQLVSHFHDVINNTKRKDVKKDDILDAICLCLSNVLAIKNDLSFLSDENRLDEMGIEMKIGFVNT